MNSEARKNYTIIIRDDRILYPKEQRQMWEISVKSDSTINWLTTRIAKLTGMSGENGLLLTDSENVFEIHGHRTVEEVFGKQGPILRTKLHWDMQRFSGFVIRSDAYPDSTIPQVMPILNCHSQMDGLIKVFSTVANTTQFAMDITPKQNPDSKKQLIPLIPTGICHLSDLLKENGWDQIMQELLCVTPRRFGKTWAVAMSVRKRTYLQDNFFR